jgi:hypothetical protein
MATFNEERLARHRVEFARQNERWGQAMRALSRLGKVRVVVRREFFDNSTRSRQAASSDPEVFGPEVRRKRHGHPL